MEFGTNLSNYPKLDYLIGDSAESLKEQLLQIRQPHAIIAIYAQGTRHVAWVSLTQQINKVVVDSDKKNRKRPKRVKE